MKINLSIEEKFLIHLLFEETPIKNEVFKEIDYDKLVKLSSSHLMLPTLYLNIKRRKYSNKIPKDLYIYLENIFNINKERNLILIKEIKELNNILNFLKIKHVFIKGSSNILSGIYYDIGERMIGDIDILVNEEDVERIINKLQINGYKNIDYSFFEDRHYTRQIHLNKLFGVEIHKKLLRKDLDILKTSEVINRSILKKNIPVPKLSDQLINNIYNYQINDYGSSYLSYSYRNIYDSYMIDKSNKNENKIFIDKNFINYVMVIKELGIPLLENYKSIKDNINLMKFRFKYYTKMNYLIYNSLIRISMIKLNLKQFKEFIMNKKYREYQIKRLLN